MVSSSDRDRAAARSAFFDRLAPSWSRSHYGPQGGMSPRITRFADALEPLVSPPADVLDYGCGSGDIAVALAARGYRVDAGDTSPKMIDSARALHAGTGVHFAVIAPAAPGTDVDLPLGDKKYDAIVCSSVLEYLNDLPGSLRLLVGSLRPGGWLLATVPNIHHPVRRAEARHRALMGASWMRSLIRLTRWAEPYELQWLSHNRLALMEWAALFHAAGLRPVWQDCQDHPLTLLVGQKAPTVASTV